jgi:hypothetical protein
MVDYGIRYDSSHMTGEPIVLHIATKIPGFAR